MEKTVQRHGGNIVEASARYGLRPEEFIDFSANINPLGVPASVRQAVMENLHLIAHYPDPSYRSLKDALSRHIGAPPENIIIGNGGAELIYLLTRVLKPRQALIPHPTFSEYGDAVLAAGGKVRTLLLSPESGFHLDLREIRKLPCLEDIDLIFLCSPNNPTGRTWRREEVLELADWLAPRGIRLVVDEAFMDFVDDWADREVVNRAPDYPDLVVLKSMTKFFALAGLRLGFAVAGRELVDRMEAAREPWSVNWLAQVAGIAALKDREYQETTRRLISEEREYLTRGLGELPGLTVWPTEANFLLVRIDREGLTTSRLQESLGPRGILVRDGSSFPGLGPRYFRVAVRSREENERLVTELRECLAALKQT